MYSLQLALQIDPATPPPKAFNVRKKKTSSAEKKNIDQTNDSQLFASQRFSVILQTVWIDLF